MSYDEDHYICTEAERSTFARASAVALAIVLFAAVAMGVVWILGKV